MKETTSWLGKILGERTWNCNVLRCKNNVEYSGDICEKHKQDSSKFKEIQEELDSWFKKYTDNEQIGLELNTLLPKNENVENLRFEYLKRLLHERDERIAALVNTF